MTHMNEYRFDGGYPDDATVSAAYDAADLMRAVQCYKHFFPLVSGAMIFAGQAPVGVVPNRVFGYMDTRPEQVGFTLNSDTPYGGILLDLHIGPVVIEIPAGPVIGAVLNFDQSWITDVGIPGRDAAGEAPISSCRQGTPAMSPTATSSRRPRRSRWSPDCAASPAKAMCGERSSCCR